MRARVCMPLVVSSALTGAEANVVYARACVYALPLGIIILWLY